MLNRVALIVSVLVISLFYYYVYALNSEYEKENFFKELDSGLQFTKNLFEEEQRYALTISSLISQDSDFLKAYYQNDRMKAFYVVNAKIKDLSHIEGSKIDVQVHDKDANTYLRSWEYSVTNVPLSSFREGIVFVKESKKKLVSVEVGKRLNIKAITPILKENNFKGSIEVIIGFEHLEKKLYKQGYTPFILLDKQYLEIATSYREAPIVANKFILTNKPQDEVAQNDLKKSDLSSLGSYGYFQKNGSAFGYFELKNLHDKRIGYFVLALKNQTSTPLKKHYFENEIEQNDKGVTIR